MEGGKEETGWGWPALSKRAHFFLEARALCGRWLYTGPLEMTDFSSPDDCKECTKRLQKRKNKEKKV